MINRPKFLLAVVAWSALLALGLIAIGVGAEPDPDLTQIVGAPVKVAGRYVYSPSPVTGYAEWVAECLTPDCLRGNAVRNGTFRVDAELPAELRISDADFDGEPWDKFHQAACDNYHNQADQNATFNYSNGPPGEKHLNRGPWRMIENKTRACVADGRRVFVITLPIFQPDKGQRFKTFGTHARPVPTHFAKAVYVEINGKAGFALAWMAANEPPRGRGPDDYKTTIDEIELASGQDFHWPGVDAETEERLEAGT